MATKILFNGSHGLQLLKTLRCGTQISRCKGYSSRGCPKYVSTNKEDKKKCRDPGEFKPDYFKTPDPCKTDKELKTERSLGVYMRCKPPYNPICMDPCFNFQRLDSKMYRPSRSLDRHYEKYWVDCVFVKRPKRNCGRIPPEIRRRKPRKPRCPIGVRLKCTTLKPLKPMKCTPIRPGPATSDTRCIKFPLCECPEARHPTRCKIKPKKFPTCKRPLTRYPSFSECIHLPLNPIPITECPKKISLCEAWRLFMRRHNG